MPLPFLALALFLQAPQTPQRTIAIDDAFAAEAHLKVGDRVVISAQADSSAAAESVIAHAEAAGVPAWVLGVTKRGTGAVIFA